MKMSRLSKLASLSNCLTISLPGSANNNDSTAKLSKTVARNLLLFASQFLCAIFQQFLSRRLLARFALQHPANGLDKLAGHGLDYDLAVVLDEVHASALLDVVFAAQFDRYGQLPFGCDVSCVHVVPLASALRYSTHHM